MLVTLNLVPGKAVYGEKRISVDVSDIGPAYALPEILKKLI